MREAKRWYTEPVVMPMAPETSATEACLPRSSTARRAPSSTSSVVYFRGLAT